MAEDARFRETRPSQDPPEGVTPNPRGTLRSTVGNAITGGAFIFESSKASSRFAGGDLSARLPSVGPDALQVLSDKDLVVDKVDAGISRTEEAVITSAMICSGALVTLFGGFMYDFSPTDASVGLQAVLQDAWLTYLLTVGIIGFEGVCSAAFL